jgi:hypothetical protein
VYFSLNAEHFAAASLQTGSRSRFSECPSQADSWHCDLCTSTDTSMSPSGAAGGLIPPPIHFPGSAVQADSEKRFFHTMGVTVPPTK